MGLVIDLFSNSRECVRVSLMALIYGFLTINVPEQSRTRFTGATDVGCVLKRQLQDLISNQDNSEKMGRISKHS